MGYSRETYSTCYTLQCLRAARPTRLGASSAPGGSDSGNRQHGGQILASLLAATSSRAHSASPQYPFNFHLCTICPSALRLEHMSDPGLCLLAMLLSTLNTQVSSFTRRSCIPSTRSMHHPYTSDRMQKLCALDHHAAATRHVHMTSRSINLHRRAVCTTKPSNIPLVALFPPSHPLNIHHGPRPRSPPSCPRCR